MTDDNSPEAPRKPSFFRRLFGDQSVPVPAAAPDPLPEEEDAGPSPDLAWETLPLEPAPTVEEPVALPTAEAATTDGRPAAEEASAELAWDTMPFAAPPEFTPEAPATAAPDDVSPDEEAGISPELAWETMPFAAPAEFPPEAPATAAPDDIPADEEAGVSPELDWESMPLEPLPEGEEEEALVVATPLAEAPRPSWWSRLRQGLSRSSSSIGQGIADIFTKRKLDAGTLEDLDDILIRADLGVATAARITEAIAKDRYDKTVDPEEIKAVLASEVERVLEPLAKPLVIDTSKKPFTILMIGVNGSGKTTTIGKLAAKFTAAGHSFMLAAGDTFRAAAVEQLKVWGSRSGVPVVVREQGADAAGLAFDAMKQAQASGRDVLLIDTAGRLQNRTELMDELAKIVRVLRKIDAEAPHAVLLVLDATVGQNAISQVEIFGRIAGVTGLVMTKLDGTARGGILVAIADRFKLPIHFIGVGEGVDDLEPFAARDFARAIAGLEDA